MGDPARRELLEKAWDDAEKAETEEKEPIEVKAEEVVETEVKDEEASGDTGAKEAQEPKVEDAYRTEKKAADEREKPEQRLSGSDKPPVAWKPAQREKWGKLDPDVRAEINRRETQIQQTLTQTDQVRKFAADFAEIVQPYSQLIAQQNSTPLRAVQNLMATAGRLSSGNPEDRARVVAEIIGNYGIDIATLDKVLSGVVQDGRVRIPNQQPEAPPQWARPMFDFMNTVQESRAQHQQRMAQEAAQEIQAMESQPFFEDLREDIADLMEVAANRGKVITLQDAYKRAVAANPEISGIIAQRKKANPLSEAGATLARARKAASTVNGAPQGSNMGAKPQAKTRREMLEQLWDDA